MNEKKKSKFVKQDGKKLQKWLTFFSKFNFYTLKV